MGYPVFQVPAGDVLPVLFTSYDGGTGASVTLTGLAVTDIEIYKDGSVTQRASDAGYTLLDTDGIDFDAITGIHGFSIDTGDNTDAGFYTVGAWFTVVVSAVTIDAQTVNFIACQFRLMAAEGVAGVPDVNTTHVSDTAQTAKDIGAAVPAAAAGASGGILISGSNSGTTTLAALTVTGTTTLSDGLVVNRSTGNASAIVATGNGTGHGISATSGSGATGNGILATAASTNGSGFSGQGTGTGDGLEATGGATGHGIHAYGGATSGSGLRAEAQAGNSNGFNCLGFGAGHGIRAIGGATGSGMRLLGGATSGHGLQATATSGNEIDADITGAITGNLSGSVGSVTGNVGGNVTGSVGSLATQAKTDVNAEIVDALNTDTYAEPGQGAPAATASIVAKIGYVYKSWRNKKDNDGTTTNLYADDATTVDQKQSTSESAGTVTKGEWVTGP